MRRRGRFTPRRSVRSFGRSFRRVGRRVGSNATGVFEVAAYGFGYGAVRPWAAQLIKPLSNMLPVGNMQDEVGLGVVSAALLVWGPKNSIVRNGARAGLTVETASMAQKMLYGGATGSNGANSF